MAYPPRATFTAATKRAILQRDRICAHCGERKSTQADHIIPVAEGGTHHISNGQGLCDWCHDKKTGAEQRRGITRWNRDRRPRQTRPTEAHPGLIR